MLECTYLTIVCSAVPDLSSSDEPDLDSGKITKKLKTQEKKATTRVCVELTPFEYGSRSVFQYRSCTKVEFSPKHYKVTLLLTSKEPGNSYYLC